MFKVYRHVLSNIVAEYFCTHQNNYNSRHSSFFAIPFVETVCHGSESLSNLGPSIWDFIPSTLKELGDVNSFKTQIKKWQPENYLFRLCKRFIPHVEFI